MPAPKNNSYAAKEGQSELFRVRVADPADLTDITAMDTYERGIALIGYLIWRESPEHDENNFIDWVKEKCHYHGIEWE